MSLIANYNVYSGITIDLAVGATALLRIENSIAYCTTTVKIIGGATGAVAVVQYTMDSFEFVEGSNTAFSHASVISDVYWQYLSVNGTPQSSITANITPQTMNAPSYIYVQNNSTGGQTVRLSIRGNKA